MHTLKLILLIAMLMTIPVREAAALPKAEGLTMEEWYEYSIAQKAEMFYEFLMTSPPSESQVAVFFCPNGGRFGLSHVSVLILRTIDYDTALSAIIGQIREACASDLQNQSDF